jgi:hypothetical protein
MRALLATTVCCITAVTIASVAQATPHYLPMRNPALVAKTYQHYLNNNGFKERRWTLGRYVVSCSGRTLTNDPAQPWHPWSTQIRKVSRTGAERRIWMDGKSLGKPTIDKTFVRFSHISGWN